MDYDQLCGALGALKMDGAELDWVALNETLRDIGRRVGISEHGDPVYGEIRTLHRQHRDMCLRRGIVRRGELFDRDDCVPLV